MKKHTKEVVLNYFSKQFSANMRQFVYLFGLLENEARNTIQNGWEKRLMRNMDHVRLKNIELYNAVVAVAQKEMDKPDSANYTFAQDHKTKNLKLIQDLDYQQSFGSLLEKLLEVQAIGDVHKVMSDLSSRIREIIEEIKNPDRFSRKTLEFEILCHEMDIERKYRKIRKIKARSSIKNMKGNLIKMTEAVSE